MKINLDLFRSILQVRGRTAALICIPIWIALAATLYQAIYLTHYNPYLWDHSEHDVPLSRELIHIYLHRYAISVKNDFEKKRFNIPTRSRFDLNISAKDLQDIENQSRQADGQKRFVSAKVKYEGRVYDADVRPRGSSYWHWAYPQKSWRIRLKSGKLINGSNEFDLVRPKSFNLFVEPVSQFFADRIGLLNIQSKPMFLFVNGAPSGVSFLQSRLDRRFLLQHGRIESSIWGIEYEVPAHMYRNVWMSKAWIDPSYWLKILTKSEREQPPQVLRKLADAVRKDSPQLFRELAHKYFDLDQFASYFALDIILGVAHHTADASIRLLWDSKNKKLLPLPWDHVFWREDLRYQPSFTPMVELWRSVPELEFLTQKKIWNLLHGKLNPEFATAYFDRIWEKTVFFLKTTLPEGRRVRNLLNVDRLLIFRFFRIRWMSTMRTSISIAELL